MYDNIKLVHLGKQKQAINEYVNELLSSCKYSLDYNGMWDWIKRLQQRLECGNYIDVPKDVLHVVFVYNSLVSRVNAYCVNKHRDYDEIMAGIEIFAREVECLN